MVSGQTIYLNLRACHAISEVIEWPTSPTLKVITNAWGSETKHKNIRSILRKTVRAKIAAIIPIHVFRCI